jgi:hypothetical protein
MRSPEDDQRPRDETPPRLAHAPAQVDGPLELDAGRHVDHHAQRRVGARELGEFVVGGEGRATLDCPAQQVGPGAQDVGERIDDNAGVARRGVQAAGDDTILVDVEHGRRALGDPLVDTWAASPVIVWGSISAKRAMRRSR